MRREATTCYEFGPFRLVPGEGQLWRGAEEIPLTQKSLAVLLMLLESGGRVVGKSEIMEQVWSGSYVEENRLADNVSTLRKALGDDPKSPRYIRTVQGRGYRFVADVREIRDGTVATVERRRARVVIEEDDGAGNVSGEAAEPAPPAAAPVAPPEAIPEGRPKLSPIHVAAALAVCVAVAAGAVYVLRARRSEPGAPVRSVAVLPFKPLHAAGRDEALELGMADSLITRLSGIRSLVVSPTSAVRSFTALESDPFEIGRRLQVDSVLEGHIQRSGERVRVTLRLVRVAGGEALWAGSYDEPYTDIFTLQDSISERVAAALGPRLSEEESARLTRRHTQNPEAFRLYTLGRFFWNRRTPEGFGKAVEYFGQAAAADPSYALAHAGLAETYVLLPSWTPAPREESYAKAERAARRALELDPQLAEAYAALGAVKEHRHEGHAAAGADYRRAVELNPNYATARHWYAEWLAAAGRAGEAEAEITAALRIDPLSPIINLSYGVMLYTGRRTVEAEAQIRRALELEPALHRARVFLARIHYDRGQYELAIKERSLALARGDAGEAARYEAQLAAAYRAGGREGFLRKFYEVCGGPEVTPEHRIGGRVEACALLHDKECTLAALDEAVRADHPLTAQIKVDPEFEFVRSDPRYAELLRRRGLPE